MRQPFHYATGTDFYGNAARKACFPCRSLWPNQTKTPYQQYWRVESSPFLSDGIPPTSVGGGQHFFGRKAVLTSGFVKKTQKTPLAVFELARKYKLDYSNFPLEKYQNVYSESATAFTHAHFDKWTWYSSVFDRKQSLEQCCRKEPEKQGKSENPREKGTDSAKPCVPRA